MGYLNEIRTIEANAKSKRIFQDGNKQRSKPMSSFGSTGISVSTPRSRRNRYQESRNNRLDRAQFNTTLAQSGQKKIERIWFNDPRQVFIG